MLCRAPCARAEAQVLSRGFLRLAVLSHEPSFDSLSGLDFRVSAARRGQVVHGPAEEACVKGLGLGGVWRVKLAVRKGIRHVPSPFTTNTADSLLTASCQELQEILGV